MPDVFYEDIGFDDSFSITSFSKMFAAPHENIPD